MTTPDPTRPSKLSDSSIAHRRLTHWNGWQVGDWHCVCGWFGNHSWEGYAGHLEEVMGLRAAGLDGELEPPQFSLQDSGL